MTEEAKNYARNIHSGEIVFFDKTTPDAVKARPEEWATWFPSNVDLARRIGESSEHYCRRNNHRPKKCSGCNMAARAA